MKWLIVLGGICLISTAVFLIPGLFNIFFGYYERNIAGDKREKFVSLSIWQPASYNIRRDFRERFSVILVVLWLGLGLSIYLYTERVEPEPIESIKRPEFGSGSTELTINIKRDDITYPLTLVVREKEADEEQLNSFFDERAKGIFGYALGKNESFEHVLENLQLTDSYDGVEVTWKISDMKYISIYGSLRGDIPEEGVDVNITAILAYEMHEREYSVRATLYPQASNANENDKILNSISDAIEVDAASYLLPAKDGEYRLSYELPGREYFTTLIGFTVVAAFLYWLVSSDKLDKAYKKREEELARDYPGILSRMAVLLSAGLSIPEAWKRMAVEYQRSIAQGGHSSAGYEELLFSVNQMQNTGQTLQALAAFGQRCQERHYRQLSNLLITGIQKGSVGLIKQMDEETAEAFRMRKENAKIAGDKAQTKLMIPTFMLFALVLIIVIYPAWQGLL